MRNTSVRSAMNESRISMICSSVCSSVNVVPVPAVGSGSAAGGFVPTRPSRRPGPSGRVVVVVVVVVVDLGDDAAVDDAASSGSAAGGFVPT